MENKLIIYELNESSVLASTNNKFDDFGLISIMYHRFDENKYPSTNIQMDIFKKHIDIIKKSNYNFHNPHKLNEQFNRNNGEEMNIQQNILINSYDDEISFNGNILFVNELEISLNSLSESDSENSILLNIDENKKKLEDVINEEDKKKIN